MTATRSLVTVVGIVASFLALFAIMSPVPAAAASTEDTLMQLRTQLERLNSNFTQMQNSSMRASGTRPVSNRATSTRPTVDRSCMQTAVNTREGSIKAAFEKYNTSIMAALDKRMEGFSSLWTGTEIKNNGRYNQVWNTWTSDNKAAHMTLRTEREAAWKTYRETARKTCRAKLPKEEASTTNKDLVTDAAEASPASL